MKLLPRRGSRNVQSPRELELARRLVEAAGDSRTAGRPLQIMASPFGMSVTDYLKAAAGPPAWSRRLLRLQEMEAQLRQALHAAREEHRRRHPVDSAQMAEAWRAYLVAIDLAPINELIDKHNAYYPIEAGLRMQWPSGRYLLPSGVCYPLAHITVETLLAEYPLSAAGGTERD